MKGKKYKKIDLYRILLFLCCSEGKEKALVNKIVWEDNAEANVWENLQQSP